MRYQNLTLELLAPTRGVLRTAALWQAARRGSESPAGEMKPEEAVTGEYDEREMQIRLAAARKTRA